MKGNINNVYLIRTFKLMSETLNNKFVENVLRIKKINEFSIKRLNLDFGEIRQALIQIGIQNGENISNIYTQVS